MKELSLKIVNDLKNYDELYIIGHNNVDCDSYFSSYILYKILRSFNINAYFCFLDTFNILKEDKNIIDDFKIEEPVIIKKSEIKTKSFILVDHNDPSQSLGDDSYNIVLSIDHHIETNKVKNTYSIEYTSTGLFIYDLFKDIYEFDLVLKDLIALTVMNDSCYLTTSRFKESDKLLYNKLNTSLDVNVIMKKYFNTTDFKLDIDYNIKNNHKVYNIENIEINRVIIKCYDRDLKYISDYINRSNEIYNNNLFILNNFDSHKTNVYYKGNLLREYNSIITSSVLIIKELIDEIKRR